VGRLDKKNKPGNFSKRLTRKSFRKGDYKLRKEMNRTNQRRGERKVPTFFGGASPRIQGRFFGNSQLVGVLNPDGVPPSPCKKPCFFFPPPESGARLGLREKKVFFQRLGPLLGKATRSKTKSKEKTTRQKHSHCVCGPYPPPPTNPART